MALQASVPTGHWPTSEEEQIRLAKARDAEVWAGWHDSYYPLLYRYALSRLGDREESEDTASQVFLEALKAIDRYVYRGQPVIAWLYGIAHHVVSHRRRERSRFAGSQEAQPEPASAGEEEAAINRLMTAALLAKLKDRHREVLILRFMLDLPSKQVAQLIGKSEAATYSLQVRALEAARRLAGGSK